MNNLRNLRKARGLSIAKLHELTGIPVRSLEDWDAEKRLLQSYHRIKALSEVLDCDMDALMTKEEDCVFEGIQAVIFLSQEEAGVKIAICDDEDLNLIFKTIIPRKKALELLKYMKDHEGTDIKTFLSEYIK